jgi:pimeloyl-ACP methyl ester carboxylesterase
MPAATVLRDAPVEILTAPSPEATMNMPTTHTTTSSDGIRIGYRRTGDGPPLVLVHGGTADHTRWRTVTSDLEQWASVYAMDRRGRGGSGDATDYAIEQEFADVAAVVRTAAESAGGPVDLVGHSFGAVCALGGARLAPDAVRRLVLYEPPIGPAAATVAHDLVARLEELLAQGKREELLVTFFREEVRVPPDELEMLRSLPAWPARIAAAHTLPRELRAVTTFDPDADWFAPVTTPTLLLLGGDSPAAVAGGTDLVARALPDARIEIMPGQQHLAMDTAPAVFTRLVRDFVAGARQQS